MINTVLIYLKSPMAHYSETRLSSMDMCLEIVNLLCPERVSYRGNEATGNWLEMACSISLEGCYL